MPELPEVETLRRGLSVILPGRRIVSVRILDHKVVTGSPEITGGDVTGHRRGRVGRRGKVLILPLGGPGSLLIHPKMTGQLIVTVAGATVVAGATPPPACWGRCRTRRPGRSSGSTRPPARTTTTRGGSAGSAWPAPARAQPTRSFAGSGPSRRPRRSRLPRSGRASPGTPGPRSRPCCSTRLSSPESATSTPTSACITPASTPPARPAGALTPAETHRLHAAVQTVLRSATETGGTSFAAYVNDFRGQRGYREHAEVFRRQGQPCDVCGTLITRTKAAGRATNLCPHCQRP